MQGSQLTTQWPGKYIYLAAEESWCRERICRGYKASCVNFGKNGPYFL